MVMVMVMADWRCRRRFRVRSPIRAGWDWREEEKDGDGLVEWGGLDFLRRHWAYNRCWRENQVLQR